LGNDPEAEAAQAFRRESEIGDAKMAEGRITRGIMVANVAPSCVYIWEYSHDGHTP